MKQESNSLLFVNSLDPASMGSHAQSDSGQLSGLVMSTWDQINPIRAIVKIEPPLQVILDRDDFTLKLLKEKLDALYSVLQVLLSTSDKCFFLLRKSSQSIKIIIHRKIEDREYHDFLKNLSLLLDHNFTISTITQTQTQITG